MEERILVEVYIPIVQMRFDIYLPKQASLQLCVDAIKEFIQKSKWYEPKEIYVFHENNNQIIPLALYVKDSGLHTGSRIILM